MVIVALFVASLCFFSQNSVAQSKPSFSLIPVGAVPVMVSTGRITNLIFPGAIRTGVKVSNDIMVQKVKGVDNVVEIKAMRKGFSPTSVSVFTTKGRVYSFLVQYSDSPGDVDFTIADDTTASKKLVNISGGVILSDMPVGAAALQGDADSLSAIHFLNRGSTYEKVRLRLRGLYFKDSLLWLTFDLRNRSLIPYRIDFLRVYSTDRKKVKRMASHESDITPIFQAGSSLVTGRSTVPFCAAFEPFTLPKGERLCIELGETNGGRTIILRLNPSVLLKAR